MSACATLALPDAVIVVVAALFPLLGSGKSDCAEKLIVVAPSVSPLTWRVMGMFAPGLSVPSAHRKLFETALHEGGNALTVMPNGSAAMTRTFVAVCGPRFNTVSERLWGPGAATVAALGVTVARRSAAADELTDQFNVSGPPVLVVVSNAIAYSVPVVA